MSSAVRRTLAYLLGLAACVAILRIAAYRGPPHDAASASAEELPALPLGAWRLAAQTQLRDVVCFTSHIVIMHADSAPGSILRPTGWSPTRKPTRSVDEARRLALRLAAQLRESPSEFPRFAAEHSDDDWTSDSGGRLGGVRASQLPPEYLDALAAMRPGDVSPAFRTVMGFHIVRREPPPPEDQVAAQRVLLRYRGSWSIDGVQSDRSREEAVALGRLVRDLAASGQVKFDALAEQHSQPIHLEHRGTFGLWSTRDPGYFPREVDRLSRLAPGEVSEPIDSPWGIEVLRRGETRGHVPVLAVVVVEIPFAPAAPLSEDVAAQRATTICAQSQVNASAFDVAIDEHCCPTTARWPLDQVPEELSDAKLLEIGAIAASPIKLRHSFAVVRRVNPEFTPTPTFDLPSPTRADIDAILTNSTGPGLAAELRAMAEAMRRLPPLTEATRDSVATRILKLAEGVEVEPDPLRRRGAVSATWAEMQRDLTEAEYGAVDAAINDWVRSRVLTPRR